MLSVFFFSRRRVRDQGPGVFRRSALQPQVLERGTPPDDLVTCPVTTVLDEGPASKPQR